MEELFNRSILDQLYDSISDDFEAIEELFNKYPELKERKPHITVY